jgi:hypothetical protein
LPTPTTARESRAFNHFPRLQDLRQSADLATALELQVIKFQLIMNLDLHKIAVTLPPHILNSISLNPGSCSSGIEIPQATASRVFLLF